MKTLRPIFFIMALLLLVGLACAAVTGGGNPTQPPPTQPVQVLPTEVPPQPTEVPPTRVLPTEAPVEVPTEAPVAQDFFTEEFDTTDNWSYFVVDGNTYTITDEDNPKMSVSTEDSFLTFDLNDKDLWVYVTYDPYEYEDVRIDTSVANRGVNNNNVSLICRYTDSGWYEFNVANNGLYWIFAALVDSDNKVHYGSIYNGGSDKIKSGKETNEYTAICKDRTLSLYINGKEVRTVTDSKYVLRSGQVGISVSSFDTLPVVADVDWVKISEP